MMGLRAESNAICSVVLPGEITLYSEPPVQVVISGCLPSIEVIIQVSREAKVFSDPVSVRISTKYFHLGIIYLLGFRLGPQRTGRHQEENQSNISRHRFTGSQGLPPKLRCCRFDAPAYESW